MRTAIIRDARLEDAERLLEIYAYYVAHTAVSFEYDVPALSAFRARMAHTINRYPYLVAEQDGIIQGYTYAGAFVGRAAYDWSCELTIYLDRTAVKHGLGRALYEALENRLSRMGILNLYACIGYPDTEDSISRKTARPFIRISAFLSSGDFTNASVNSGAGMI